MITQNDKDPVAEAMIHFAAVHSMTLVDAMFLFFCCSYQFLTGLDRPAVEKTSDALDDVRSGAAPIAKTTTNIQQARNMLLLAEKKKSYSPVRVVH